MVDRQIRGIDPTRVAAEYSGFNPGQLQLWRRSMSAPSVDDISHREIAGGHRPALQSIREQNSVLTPVEKRVLIWLARRMPAWINSDHLTLLGFLGMAG